MLLVIFANVDASYIVLRGINEFPTISNTQYAYNMLIMQLESYYNTFSPRGTEQEYLMFLWAQLTLKIPGISYPAEL